jgi:hypothetical protein
LITINRQRRRVNLAIIAYKLWALANRFQALIRKIFTGKYLKSCYQAMLLTFSGSTPMAFGRHKGFYLYPVVNP